MTHRHRAREVGPVAVLVAAVLLAVWCGLKCIPASLGYEVVADFAEVPPDDRALESWLRSHPGVWSASVSRQPASGRTCRRLGRVRRPVRVQDDVLSSSPGAA